MRDSNCRYLDRLFVAVRYEGGIGAGLCDKSRAALTNGRFVLESSGGAHVNSAYRNREKVPKAGLSDAGCLKL